MNSLISKGNNCQVPRKSCPSFSKEDYDVSLVFLAYLTFLGNSTKVGIALKMRPEVVEVLAEKEHWDAKLETYIGLRNKDPLAPTDRAIRRTVTLVQACFLRDMIDGLLNRLHRHATPAAFERLLSPRNRRTNKPHLTVKTIVDLCRALNLATRVIERTSFEKGEPPAEVVAEKERLRIRDAITRAMNSADQLPGVDSVALTKESLTEWGGGSGETRNDYEYMTLEEFTISRRDELIAFFKARYGAGWRKTVAIQADMHPRWFERWKCASPLSLYRQIHKLESHARSIGFQSATDAEVQSALRKSQEFAEVATHEIEQCKQNEAERALEEQETRLSGLEIEAAIRRAMETQGSSRQPSSERPGTNG